MVESGRPLSVVRTSSKGLGVIAGRTFAEGDFLLRFGGERRPAHEVVDFTHVIQIGDDVCLGPSGSLDDLVNHSCEPVAGLRSITDGLELHAIREIAKGQEITFDYSTCMVWEPPIEPCLCGSPRCRGRVAVARETDRELMISYASRGALPDFVARLLGICLDDEFAVDVRGRDHRQGQPLRRHGGRI